MKRKEFLQVTRGGALASSYFARPGLSDITSNKTRIKITKVEPVPIKANRDQGATGWMLVRVHTDQGIQGIGEGFPLASRSLPNIREIYKIIQTIGTHLVGVSPLGIEAFLNRFSSETSSPATAADLFRLQPLDQPKQRRSPGAPSTNWVTAISAIEVALWDITGQVAGLPIHAFPGRTRTPDHPALCQQWRVNALEQDTQERFDRAICLKEAGSKCSSGTHSAHWELRTDPRSRNM